MNESRQKSKLDKRVPLHKNRFTRHSKFSNPWNWTLLRNFPTPYLFHSRLLQQEKRHRQKSSPLRRKMPRFLHSLFELTASDILTRAETMELAEDHFTTFWGKKSSYLNSHRIPAFSRQEIPPTKTTSTSQKRREDLGIFHSSGFISEGNLLFSCFARAMMFLSKDWLDETLSQPTLNLLGECDR